jgi:PIN domain nuclease of toxin-antitoxin system
MKILLDSHIVVWLATEPEKLKKRERSAIEDTDNTLLVSPVTIQELHHKAAMKPDEFKVPENLMEELASIGLVELPVRWKDADLIKMLPMIHRDPFDRILAAQSMASSCVLMTRDRELRKYPISIF